MASRTILAVILLSFQLASAINVSSSFSSYRRPPPRRSLFVRRRLNDNKVPEQVHISLVGEDKMRISWITDDETRSTVYYGTSKGVYSSTNGTVSSYKYVMYTSGSIHDVVIGPLQKNTVHYYRCGSLSNPELSFKTPPAQLPIKFAIAGDLGQTEWTSTTLQHISASNYDVLLLPGDLSYADTLQPLWDSFGRLVEPLATQRPWMVTQGNHEIEKIPVIHSGPFTSYNARWHMPFEESGSDSNLYYSFNVPGVHVIMLGSYANFGPESSQYKWLQADLAKVDRSKTPWIVVLIHAPWYNSNAAHQGEDESVDMRKCMERLLYSARVDIVFAGHVHAYERFTRVYKGQADKCGAIHITIGDGGNREGLAKKYINPQPSTSIFREASFGHGELEVVNSSHALWTWHRNDNDSAVVADSIWFTSLVSDPSSCKM